MQNDRPAIILVVEDNDGDACLIKEFFRTSKIENSLHLVINGDDALNFLQRLGQFAEAPRPDLILLDLNLPGMNGHELLDAIKADESLKTIPVVIMSSSTSPEDILLSYSKQASCYISKPIELDDYATKFGALENFWFNIVRLPSYAS